MSRQALAASALGHAIVVWALFIFVPSSPARIVPSSIQVALVNPPPGRTPPARGVPAAAPPPKTAPEPKANDPEEAPPEKNAVRPPDTKQAAPRRPAPGLPQGSTHGTTSQSIRAEIFRIVRTTPASRPGAPT